MTEATKFEQLAQSLGFQLDAKTFQCFAINKNRERCAIQLSIINTSKTKGKIETLSYCDPVTFNKNTPLLRELATCSLCPRHQKDENIETTLKTMLEKLAKHKSSSKATWIEITAPFTTADCQAEQHLPSPQRQQTAPQQFTTSFEPAPPLQRPLPRQAQAQRMSVPAAIPNSDRYPSTVQYPNIPEPETAHPKFHQQAAELHYPPLPVLQPPPPTAPTTQQPSASAPGPNLEAMIKQLLIWTQYPDSRVVNHIHTTILNLHTEVAEGIRKIEIEKQGEKKKGLTVPRGWLEVKEGWFVREGARTRSEKTPVKFPDGWSRNSEGEWVEV